RQLILHLVTNAAEALGEAGGEVRIRVRPRTATPEELASPFIQRPPEAGEFVVLEVSDTGCGMAEETLARAFDPFLTTKLQGRGLGLSAVLGIVRGHGGSLQVHSRPGEGTTFQVYLPRASEAPARTSAPGPAEGGPISGTVLVADDDPLMRALT